MWCDSHHVQAVKTDMNVHACLKIRFLPMEYDQNFLTIAYLDRIRLFVVNNECLFVSFFYVDGSRSSVAVG